MTFSDSLILNVDDTDAARYAKTRILSRAGFKVIEAANGAQALEQARIHKPNLVLLDVKLPDINGMEVCRLLKQDTLTQTILVLQTSASYLASADKIRALEGGADNYLFEPIEPEELVANVRALLRLGNVERELREVDRRKDEFLAMLAHELRNPLGPIRSAVELLGSCDPKLQDMRENARQTIIRQTDHMVRLVDDLLDVSRISQGKMTLFAEPAELQEIISVALETAEPIIKRRQHRLTVDIPKEPIRLVADAVRLSQVVFNLLNNAAKFTPPGGQLALTVTLVNGQAVIQVRDNGIGIASENLQSIFGFFSQAEHAPDRVKDGLGIGLSLVKTIVELHGGQVSATSAGLDKGSTFEVRLPVPAMQAALFAAPSAAAAEAAAPEPEPEASPRGGKRILVVDDSVDSADMLRLLLEICGHQVEVAHTGAEAIEAAQRFKPETAFLDIGLPDMSGLEVATRLRSLPATRDAVLVALTGYGQKEDKERSLAAGFTQHLTKPVTLEDLTGIIDAERAPIS